MSRVNAVNPGSRLEAVRRLTWIGAGLLLWGVAILVKLVLVQIVHHDTYLARARKQQEHEMELTAPRGTIFDRNGEPLAMSVPVDSVFVNPSKVPDRGVASEVLSGILHLDNKALLDQMNTAAEDGRGFMWVKRKISPQESTSVRSLQADWIGFQEESRRFYPNNANAAHIVGSVFREEEGAEGVEKGMEKSLKGHPGQARLLTDVRLHGIESTVALAPQPGQPLTLTIDERIQFVAERELAAQVEALHARSGTVIVMNPYTGDILALANYPTFDPNKPPVKGEAKFHFNLGAQVPFEPGSIFKVVTLATALETTDIRPETLINCHNGALKLPGRVVHEAHGGYGMLTMAQVLEKSSNIGAIEIGSHIGREKFYEYLNNFGFGARTGIPLPAESKGILRKLNNWGTTSQASISMGQEIGTTSLQLGRACSAVANGGILVTPKLILKSGDQVMPNGPTRRVLRPETTITMRQMMEGVVLRGTGKAAKLNGWTSAGKTGTAQIFEDRHYTHLYNASFMGFAPVPNPRFVVVVTVNGTTGGAGYGGHASAPIFNKVMSETLRVFDVPKDLPETPVKPAKPLAPEEVADLAIVDGIEGQNILEDDPDAFPHADLQLVAQTTQVIGPQAAPAPPKPQGPVIPDFRGKPMRMVAREALAMGLSLEPEGSGIARLQSPAAGMPLRPGETIRVRFAR